MKKILVGVAVMSLLVPLMGQAAVAKQKTLTGTVTRTVGNQITFKTTAAAMYTAETSTATLAKKYGAAMNFNEILVGDKVEVKGMVWPDNSINAQSVKNQSLYVHNSTFSGKVGIVNPTALTFTLESKANGTQTIRVDNFSIITKNGSAAGLAELQTGMSVTVKGKWERSNKNLTATVVKGTLRLVNISFTGRLVMMSPIGFTVVGANNAMYGVDFSNAAMTSKNKKPMGWAEFRLDDIVSVKGKHISGMQQVTASEIKDTSLSK